MNNKPVQTAEEFFKKRLLYDEKGYIFTPFDELISFVRMFTVIKCEEQRYNCAMELDYKWEEDTDELIGVNLDSIIEAKQPIL